MPRPRRALRERGGEDRLPVLRARPADVAPAVLVVGDPERARGAAELLDDVREVGRNREFVTFTGRRGDCRLSVCSHGVGSPGAAICFEELMRSGATTLVRAGTCGALRDELRDGSLLIAAGAVRDEGTTPRLVPLAFPAFADRRVVVALETALASDGESDPEVGVVLSSDTFYPAPGRSIDWSVWQASRVAAVEMEMAALFVVAALHGRRAGGILTVDGNPTRAAQDMSEYDPHREPVQQGVTRMLRLAIDALVRLSANEAS